MATSFDVAPGVSEQDAGFVEEGIILAEEFFTSQISARFTQPIHIDVEAGFDLETPDLLAYFDGGKIVVLTGSPVWQQSIPAERFATIVHEFTHVYQSDVMGFDNIDSPAWFEEGVAEYLSYALLGQLGLLDHQALIDYDTTIVTLFLPDKTLASISTWNDFQREGADVYALSHAAVAHLMDGLPISVFNTYYTMLSQGYTIDQVFTLLFGVTPNDFSLEMTDYFNEWQSPGGSAIFDDYIDEPLEQPRPVQIVEAPSSVIEGNQFLVTGITDPATVCTLLVVGAAGNRPLIERTTFADGTGDLFWLVTIPTGQPDGLVTIEATCGSGLETRVAILS